MPVRNALILAGLFGLCVTIVLLAWAGGSEFYVFFPVGRLHRRISVPPTDPLLVLGLMAACAAIFLYSPKYALTFFAFLLAGLVLGSIVGYCVFAWKTTLWQVSLTIAMFSEMIYACMLHRDCLGD